MKVEQGPEGIWCASGNGNLRPIVAYSHTRKEAVRLYGEAYMEQLAQEYEYEQSMSHLADVNDPEWTETAGFDYER